MKIHYLIATLLINIALIIKPDGSFAQDKKSVYVGIEPLLWLMGEKGGYIDYIVSDKISIELYAAHFGWWWSKGDIRQLKWDYLPDYVFAAKGPVIRIREAFLIKENPVKISKFLLSPEITYKYLSYSKKCFHEGSGGSSYDLFQLRSMTSHLVGIHAGFVYRHCDSSEWDLPVEWFVGPGILLAFEEKHLLGQDTGISPLQEYDIKTTKTSFYPSVRLGVRIGIKIAGKD